MQNLGDDQMLMNAYVRKRPELIDVFGSMIHAYRTAARKGKRCTAVALEPLYAGLVHPIAGIWHVAVFKAHALTKSPGPVFEILERVLTHPKASIRNRIMHCIKHDSLHAPAMSIVEKMTSDKVVGNRITAYWLALRLEKRMLRKRLEAFYSRETNKKGQTALDEIKQFIKDGYILEHTKYGVNVVAFCKWGYFARGLTHNEFQATNIKAIVAAMGRRQPG